jgi:UDP-glucuronate 4-epimerase
MSTYLVSGVAGFIGARLAESLLERGDRVIGVDNLNTAYDIRLKHWRLNRLTAHPLFTFRWMDISQPGTVERLGSLLHQQGEMCDAVINMAARAGVRQSVENPWVYLDTNITGTLNLLEFSRQYGVPKFIQASTSSVYGAHAPLPTPEEADSSHPLQPYAASKKGAEALCHVYHYLYHLDVTIFRYFTVYGPAGRPDMVMFRFVQWISEGRPVRVNGDGEQMRGFTYIDDIVRGTLAGLKSLGYQIINLGGHETITINGLIRLMERLIGRDAQVVYRPPHPADMLANWADVRKAKQLLGWQPQVNLEEGVSRLVEWYHREREWASQVQTE